MNAHSADIVHSSQPVTLIGGGELNPRDLAEALTRAPFLVAADGGAVKAMSEGAVPEAVIGDMDSLPTKLAKSLGPLRLHPIAEQDSTDFDKALRSIQAPFVLGLGLLGGRVDHQLANFNVLVRRPSPPCLLLGSEDVVFAAPPRQEIGLSLATHSRVSLFPMAPVTGRSEGLEWPISGLDFAPEGRIGTSNRSLGGPVRLWFDGPGMLVILPRLAMDAAISALCDGSDPHAR